MKIVLRKIGIAMLILLSFVHNTTILVSIGCTPTLIFHGREPTTALEMRFRRQTLKIHEPEMILRMKFKMFWLSYTPQLETRLWKHTTNMVTIMTEKHLHHFWKSSFCLLLNSKLVNVKEQILNKMASSTEWRRYWQITITFFAKRTLISHSVRIEFGWDR